MEAKTKKKKKHLSEKQKMIIIICVVCAVVLAYAARAVYYNFTGAVETELIDTVTEYRKISADGIVIRDENSNENGSSILKKTVSGIYTPAVADGESVAKNECIAYVFSDESQVKALNDSKEAASKIAMLEKLQNSGNLNLLDVSMLNNEISAAVRDYITASDENDFSNYDSIVDEFCYKITSKQIITGQKIDFTAQIDALEESKKHYDSLIGSKTEIYSPKAGYFVSAVDGYESSFDYEKAGTDGFTPQELKKMKKIKLKSTDNVYGKIISEHAWYFVFAVSFLDSSTIKIGNTVSVSFPERGVSGVEMKVYKINRDKDEAAVVLKCMTMNEKMLNLRKEKAVIELEKYTGIKISNEAIRKNDDGTTGIYVYAGNCAVFKPIEIIYSSDDYVIAKAVTEIEVPESESESENENLSESNQENEEEPKTQKVDEKHILKAYDRAILKGRNLYDGKVIG
ncbi:MAG: HlyD family efflux transporter periplasmic adaptor subunit [Acutalibacteraceae bacterium]